MQMLKDVMSHDVQVIGPDGTIREAAKQMLEGNFGMMPVEENNFMVGVISDRDIAIRAIAEGKDANTKVRDIMSRDVIVANEGDSVEDAADLMSQHQIRRLPVVNAEKQLVGIVALGDFAVDSEDIDVAGDTLSEISKAA
jgi:CBS domain-containing protein